MYGFLSLTKQIASDIRERLRVECADSASAHALIKRTAKLRQVSERTLYWWKTDTVGVGKVLPLKKRSCGEGPDRTKKLDNFDLSVLLTVVHGFFEKGGISTIAKPEQRFKEDEMLSTMSMTMIQRMLVKFSFKYKKRSVNAFLIEATLIVLSRHRYLRQVAALR